MGASLAAKGQEPVFVAEEQDSRSGIKVYYRALRVFQGRKQGGGWHHQKIHENLMEELA